MRAIFFGTPEFAVPSLEGLLAEHQVPLVVTQPDRPAGRGMTLRRAPVAEVADRAGLPVLQPQSARDPQLLAAIRDAQADVAAVAAYGRILPPEVLEATPHGGINVHASVLPRWRGASPVAAAILAGDPETGISIMRMDEGLDSGPVLVQRRVPIDAADTTATITPRLANLGAEALLEALRQLEAGTARPQPQAEDGVTHAPPIRKSDGDLDWDMGAADIERRLRAYDPWPGVRLPIGEQTVRVLEGRALPGWTAGREPRRPGEVLAIGPEGVEVMAADVPFLLRTVQPPGRRPMAAIEYARGRRDLVVAGG
jgi:methionyl-tRNA formyltransferase